MDIAAGDTVFDSTGQVYRLTPLGGRGDKGGEGQVFSISGSTTHVAKIYFSKKRQSRHRKIEAMLSIAAVPGESDCFQLAWPSEMLFSKGNQFVGFIMPLLDHDSRPLHQALTPQEYDLPNQTWGFNIKVARNLALMLARLHAKDMVIGDINPNNIYVGIDATVTLIDCDSMQINCDGELFHCPVAAKGFAAPELLNAARSSSGSYASIRRTPEMDIFTMAILFTQLLYLGRSPFVDEDHPEAAVEKGKTWLVEQGLQTKRVFYPSGLSSGSLLNLFRQTFGAGHRDPLARPVAEDWLSALESESKALVRCYQKLNHLHGTHLSSCPWCEINRQSGWDPWQGTHAGGQFNNLPAFSGKGYVVKIDNTFGVNPFPSSLPVYQNQPQFLQSPQQRAPDSNGVSLHWPSSSEESISSPSDNGLISSSFPESNPFLASQQVSQVASDPLLSSSLPDPVKPAHIHYQPIHDDSWSLDDWESSPLFWPSVLLICLVLFGIVFWMTSSIRTFFTGDQGAPVQLSAPATARSDRYIVNVDGLNFRSGPGGEFEVLEVLVKDQPVVLLNRDNEGQWARVRPESGREIGWVAFRYLTRAEQASSPPNRFSESLVIGFLTIAGNSAFFPQVGFLSLGIVALGVCLFGVIIDTESVFDNSSQALLSLSIYSLAIPLIALVLALVAGELVPWTFRIRYAAVLWLFMLLIPLSLMVNWLVRREFNELAYFFGSLVIFSITAGGVYLMATGIV